MMGSKLHQTLYSNIILNSYASISIGGMKESKAGGEEGGDGEPAIELDVTAEILEICLKFMHYKTVNRKVSFERPPFHIEPALALEVLKASIYL